MSRVKGITLRKTILMSLPITAVLIVILLSLATYWLVNTASGAAWLFNKLKGLEFVEVRYSQISGDLNSGFVVQDMKYQSTNLDLLIRRAEIEAGFGWWPLTIKIDRLSLEDVEVLTRSSDAPGTSEDSDEDIRNTLASFDLPLPLEVNDAVLTNISLQQDGRPASALAESVRLKATLDERLVIDHLDVMAAGIETRLQGYLQFEPPFVLGATLQGRFEMAGEAGQTIFELPFKLESSGDLEKLQFKMTSQKYGLQVDGEILDPVSSPAWKARLVLDRFQWSENRIGQGTTFSALNLTSQGNINNWSFELDSGLDTVQLQDVHVAFSGSGSANTIEVNEATVNGPGVDLGFEGKLDWSLQPRAGFKAVIRQLDVSPWISDWPVGEQLAGDLELSWSGNKLEIPTSQLTVVGTDLMVGIETDIDVESNSVNGRLNWRNLRWPLKSATTQFSSESGQLHISGSVDDWLADGQLIVQMGDYPKGRFDIRGEGNGTSTRLVIPGGEILGGTLGGDAEADWSDGLKWSAAIQTKDIDPEPLLPGWPGRLDSDIEIIAQSQSQQIQLKLLSLRGLIRDVPISARGGLKVNQANLSFQSLQVRTDEAELALNGNPGDPDGATVKFSGSLPSALLQGARGSLELEGRYSNHAAQPLLEIELQGLDIAWNDLIISNLVVSTPEVNTATNLPAMQLDATGMILKDFAFDEFALSVSPVDDQIEVKAVLQSEGFVLKSLMNLVNESRDDPFGGPWRGELNELELAIGPAYLFELSKPARFSWSSGSTLLGPVCLAETVGASLCLGLDYQNNGDWSLLADATAVPLDYLRDYLELDVHFEQLIGGHMEWHQPHDKPPTGGADFRITAGKILDLLDNEVLTETKEGQFAFKLQNGNLESGVLNVEFPGTGFIDVGFDILDIMVGGAQKIQGRAIARLDHFKLAGHLALPGVDAVDGQFESNIQLGGTMEDPDFDGAFKLSNGSINYSPIGLQLEDIEFEGQINPRDRGEFKGQFRAGEGVGLLSGSFLFDDIGTAQLEIDLTGEQLLLANTDTLNILTETDLQLVLGPRRMDINGRIIIPNASLTPSNLLLGEVRDSDDLVIETPGAEVEPDASKAPEINRIHGQLEVSFGDDVLIKLPGIETNLTGSTLFNWSGDPVPLAEGGYTLQGQVDVYGPRLTINNGSISFPSVPANNPILNIRAGRDIFGNTQIRCAGVRVIGSLKRPVVEAYTVPVTNEDRAWTLLITGTDFDQGQGVSGFDVGTYIAPKLYVSYGVSLFEDENVISARYDIMKGFGIKVTSGQRETGLDVSYTIDK